MGHYSRNSYRCGNFGSISLIIGTVLVLFIFILSFRYGTKDITTSDKIFLGVALLAIIIWWQLDNPLIAVLLVSLIDGLGYVPTIRKSFRNPWSETVFFWLMMAFVDILALAANAAYNPLTVVYLSTLAVFNLTIVFVCLCRRKILSKT